MPCLAVVFAFFVPRVTLVVLWLLGAFHGVWQTMLWPVLGFFFMPYTTVAYGLAYAYGNGLQGIWLVFLIIGVLLDFGSNGSAATTRRSSRG
ncbi:MAG: hypothetical protein KDA21_08805 [Phycisphaerales bacterium]|nr:hypothetical protein [Phycisphaerales bacterium]